MKTRIDLGRFGISYNLKYL